MFLRKSAKGREGKKDREGERRFGFPEPNVFKGKDKE